MTLRQISFCFFLCFCYGMMKESSTESDDKLKTVNLSTLMTFVDSVPYTIVLVQSDSEVSEAESVLARLKPELEAQLRTEVVRLTEPTNFIKKYYIHKLPSILFFRQTKPIIYDGPFTLDDVSDWFLQNLKSKVQILTDDSFEHLTQAATGATTGDWFVLFCNETEKACESLQPVWDSVASRIISRTNVAFVDSEKSVALTSRFKIQKTPEMIFYRLGKMYRYTFNIYDISYIISFASNWYKNSKAETVPVPPSAFDRLIDKIVLMLKKEAEDPFFIPALGMISLPVSVCLFALYARRYYNKTKTE